ncbi:PadR family transcriptional regulator [Cumulibacter soli]|uniref:PadR family transcriptional regulator n=1 Tax=Cumulibacter soli TaxID=2546344 RepID=UPI0010676FE9|nr:helix-turn-helix transcriptional regulator [Cumulibacter soli]
MSLRFAILTALTEKSSTGIELARRFDRSIGYFWPATHQQIYRELDKLLDAGLIAVLDCPEPPGRGNPRTFAVLPAGTDELRDWSLQVMDAPKRRDPLMVQIRAASALGDVDIRPLLREHLQRHEARLAQYVDIERKQFADGLDPRSRMQLMVLRAGIATERMWVEWCRESLAALE